VGRFVPWQAKGPTKHSVAVKTTCPTGCVHDSKREARRCAQLRLMERAGAIAGLQQQPFYPFGTAMLENNQPAGVTLDFSYVEGGKLIAEDVKPRSKKADDTAWPLRKAMFRMFYPHTELREVRS
jgi:hypothetical protein